MVVHQKTFKLCFVLGVLQWTGDCDVKCTLLDLSDFQITHQQPLMNINGLLG